MVIYHQKLFLMIYQLTTPSDPSSVLLKAKNWKGFVTQSLESLTFSTLTASSWITPLFGVLGFFFTLWECAAVRFRWVRGGSFFGKRGKRQLWKGKWKRGPAGAHGRIPGASFTLFVVSCRWCALEALQGEPACHRHVLRAVLEASREELTIWKLFHENHSCKSHSEKSLWRLSEQ